MIDKPRTLLGGLTPAQFMRHYWQKKPLLVRGALPGIKPPVSIAELKQLARHDDVQSRLIQQKNSQWHLKHGPFDRLPGAKTPNWTLLVQSLDIHDDKASELLHQFDFVPAARLDDLMASIATLGGGVGPHFDSYDVFLIQAQGTRRWQFGQQEDLTLVPNLPLKILANFKPEQTVDLEPGDMLYLPPQAAHDGVAMSDDCMTLSVGFRAPDLATLAQGMLESAAEQIAARTHGAGGPVAEPPLPGPDLSARFRDPRQRATLTPGELPDILIAASVQAVKRVSFDESLARRYLGCWLTEPNALAVFDESDTDNDALEAGTTITLDRRSRLLYAGLTLFINGEVAPVKANAFWRELADRRQIKLTTSTLSKLSDDARDCLQDWLESGWVHTRKQP